MPNEDDTAKFKRHNRLLKSLKADTLLIIDNFNEVDDPRLDMLMGYRCRILFTTRNRFEDQPCLELQELDADDLVQLIQYFYGEAEANRETVTQIIDTVHHHTFAVELAARLLAKVIKRTPVGDYSGDPYACAGGQSHKGSKVSGKVGGTLRRGWTAGRGNTAKSYAESLQVTKQGNDYVIEVINPVEYASYVEFGHRTRDHKGWVEGHFMLTISEDEIRKAAPRVLEKKLEEYLKKCF